MKPGYVYDEKMCSHFDLIGDHPERPRRITFIYDILDKSGLLENFTQIDSRKAAKDELSLVHTKEHINFMSSIPSRDVYQLDKLQHRYNSVYLNKDSYDAALLSCGSTIALCEAVVTDKVKNGFAIVRPPGHHAEHDKAMGFCLFNNVAIAAKVMQEKFGVKKIAIVDWDVHHGNATQNTFYEDDSVLFISLHRYDDGTFYPGRSGDPKKVGSGTGKGFNVNIAWNTGRNDVGEDTGIGDAEYLHAFKEVIKPMLQEFQPELIIISAGFDSAEGDPLGQLHVTPAGYNYLTRELMKISKVAIVLEGGYNLESISKSAKACCQALVGEHLHIDISEEIDRFGKYSVDETKFHHRSLWKFLQE